MKKVLMSLSIVLLTISTVLSQDVNETVTKMDAFTSKTGSIIKYVDFNLPNIKSSYNSSQTKVRKLISSGEVVYFYQISAQSKYGTKSASIAYEDLLEVIKAINTLKSEASTDLILNPDYLENKFITDDGFQIGYYVSKGKLKWYIKLEKYGSDNTLYIKDFSKIESAFIGAKSKIEELKQ